MIERTSLLRHYNKQGYNVANGRVNLVGHSMGGLIIAGFVQQHGLGKIDKVVTLASPFRGSIESITKTTLGGGGFSSTSGGSREREAARLTPALYHLLPSYDGAVKPVKRDVYLPENWQHGIVWTLAGFIERNSLLLKESDPKKRETESYNLAEGLLTKILDDAWEHRSSLEKLRLPYPKRWLSIVGVGAKTRVHVKITADSKVALSLPSRTRPTNGGHRNQVSALATTPCPIWRSLCLYSDRAGGVSFTQGFWLLGIRRQIAR